ncbi:MAG: MATE family efflux transporter, partial [Sphaerochaetaceae bacterium]|nr:MATE family efflux transporter [Sphaerochaetaceae bacterium]
MKLQPNKSIFSQLMKVSLPIMASNLLQTLYNLVDAYYLGKLGKEAISAPSITMNISNFIIVFGVGFSIAGT